MKISLLFVCLLLLSLANANNKDLDLATRERIAQSAERFFDQESIIEMTVEADFTALRSDRDRATNEYHQATITLQEDGGNVVVKSKVKTRGNFRLKNENCDFPPLRFKFKTSHVINTVFEGQDKLKLVTHCRDTSLLMQQAVLREYLTYKMYNSLSDNSLRVRMVKMKYVDTQYDDEIVKYGFFIESVDQMSRRTGLEEVEMANLTQDQLIQDNIIQLALFNYMIGNTDWSVPKLHNVTLLRSDRHSPPVAVPYDFDMSEFVDACYMKVYMGRELLENRYKGKKVPMDVLEKAIDNYTAKRKALVNTILNFDYLDLDKKQECLAIVDSFYETINNKQAARRAFIAEAKK
ncbi:hypothetical protein [Carboxylicivirga sp. M1479]|uniref:hypothetical protein n=1 Tax=Carboxylicivirga sp. M1479 TaxID=2594476 RepID=UPI0011776F99|nr:hypothetical protein [Carboxylicivirga sp. M1479]TRX65859.1 hypothetical protein FNN09_16345 [Carboxylicivirga sp. M1479]